MKNKFRKEKYITQVYKGNSWSFRVRVNGHSRNFNESDYLSASMAFDKAIEYRNKHLVNGFIGKDVTVDSCFEEIDDIYVLRSETKRQINCYYSKYVTCKEKKLKDVTRADIIKDLNAMVDTCTNSTITRVFSIYRKIFGVAISKQYINVDTTLNIKPPLSRKIKAKKRLELTDEQTLDTLANHLESRLISKLESSQARAILFTLLYSGMRPAEMFALDKSDVDLKKRTISITKEMGSDRDSANVIRPCKTEMSHRVIPISDKLLPILREQMLTEGEILFPNKNNKHYAAKDLGDRYHLIAKKIGIDFHFYQCRHTFITNLFMKGVDLKTIQMIVGQNVDATTIGYVVSDEERMKNAINMI